MPLDNIGSYPSVMTEFDEHWGSVNAAQGGTATTDLKLEGAFTRAQFQALLASIVAKLTGAQGLENTRQIAAQNRDLLKVALRERLFQLRGMVRGLLPKTAYAVAIPVLPELSAAESRFLDPFDDAADLWSRIDVDAAIAGFTPPLVIGPYARAMFVADIVALRAAFAAMAASESAIALDIHERDLLLETARERMVQYRILVEAICGTNHPLTQSLPNLFPAPGSTPATVILTGEWNVGLMAAVLNWTASTNPNLVKYEIRMSPGLTYDAATASVIGNVMPGILTFQTTAGLANSGDVASFKVFVKLSTGNEAGSNTVTITRP